MDAPALPLWGPLATRTAVPVALGVVVAGGWAATALLCGGMEGHAAHAGRAAVFGMWAAMALAMMVPVEAPSLVRLARGGTPFAGAAAFLAGYLLPWMAFGLAAAVLQDRLHALGVLDMNLAASSRAVSAGLLAAAAAVQLSPWRQACLDRCRHASLLGVGGGLRRGFSSIACCGLLMLVPVAAGGMSVWWMAALTLLLLAERELPRLSRIGSLAGAVLVLSSAWKWLA